MNEKLNIIATTVAALLLTACQKAPQIEDVSNAKLAQNNSSKKYIACMVSDSGGFNDKSFNESGKAGLDKAAKELDVKAITTESRGAEDFKKNIDSLVAQHCDIIIGVGFMLNDAIRNAAKANPNINFALIDSDFTDKDGNRIEIKNAKPLLFNTAEAAFLAGYLAAGMTKTGVVATYGGMSIPSVDIFRDGFYDGIKQYNSDNDTTVRLLGWDKSTQKGSAVGSFEDTAKGKELTEQFIAQNADIILPVAGQVGNGTLSAVKSSGGKAKVIWVDSDGYNSTPFGGIILSSIVKGIGEAVFQTIKDSKHGENGEAGEAGGAGEDGGNGIGVVGNAGKDGKAGEDGKIFSQPYIGTLANKGVDITPFHDFEDQVPAKLKQDLLSYRDKIIAGELKIESSNQP